MDFNLAREIMVDSQIRPNDVTDAAIVAAFLRTPREEFVPSARRSVAYSEMEIETSKGRSLWTPRDTAKLIKMAQIQPGDVVLVIAAGTGYEAALISHMADTVIALEDSLPEAIRSRLAAMETLHPRLDSAQRDAVHRFYEERGFGSLWIDGTQESPFWTAGAKSIQGRIQAAGEDALEPASVGALKRRNPRSFDLRFHLGPEVSATPTADAAGALLKLPNGRLWQMKARGGTLAIEPSLWVDPEGQMHKTSQLVISGQTEKGAATIGWSLKRAGR
jgi:protein-L-isoaspartate(D-aspartate) O-methyltransferase